ncbi:MAG: valine--tRNA ligase [Patescibacteria group bacterium]|nr:valine--tRNA ligase [Patescibacteria group bacterium]
MDTRYDYGNLEDKTYAKWEKSGYFNPDICVRKGVTAKNAKKFSIVLPPPNVTGTLHIGSAAMLTIEDIMARYARMRGLKTLWLPGTDHAAIATQAKVESLLFKQEGKTRYDLGREAFLKRVEEFAKNSHDTIVRQMKKMGTSVDWSREAYTLDEKRSLAVRTAFKRMYDGGLIYKGSRIVNWDPKMQTTVSDDELEYLEEKTPFYYLKFGPFVIGTARPETKFGDKYVVMHPADKRYAEYRDGEKLKVEWINGPITATIVKDKAVDMKFGTGVMTITPWHDATDFEIAERHNLDKEQIIDYNGKLLPAAGEFSGMHINKARPLIVEKFKSLGLIEKFDENYVHNVAVNQRGGGRIEPQIKEQWFVSVNREFALPKSKIKGIKSGEKTTLKKMMKAAVKSNQIAILPKRFEKTYFHWIDNLRDWCISRQIWYGHRIPVWYKNGETYCGINPPKGPGWIQDSDTLDTWFSSGLWTFSTLGWPRETKDFSEFHPTSVLETGYDILFFWVARMILMSGYLLGDIPFHKVYLHGLVRDEQGRKMSKSLDNAIDPLEVSQKYGADAVRLSLIIGSAPGNDIKISEDKIRGYRNFATKIWNASRFAVLNFQPAKVKPKLTAQDKKRLAEVEALKKKVSRHLDEFDFNRAGGALYHYFWDVFADKVIESLKPRLNSENAADRAAAQEVLMKMLKEQLKMLHPFMPFVTEEIWSLLPENKNKLLMVEKWR